MSVKFDLSTLSQYLWTKLTLASLIVVGAAIALIVTIIAQSWRNKDDSTANQVSATAQQTTDKPDKINTINSIRLTITRSGIIPAEVEMTEGHFFLQVDSLIGKDNPNYVIAKEGYPSKLVNPARGSRRWREVMFLSPGEYVISVAGEPQLRSLLKVSRR